MSQAAHKKTRLALMLEGAKAQAAAHAQKKQQQESALAGPGSARKPPAAAVPVAPPERSPHPLELKQQQQQQPRPAATPPSAPNPSVPNLDRYLSSSRTTENTPRLGERPSSQAGAGTGPASAAPKAGAGLGTGSNLPGALQRQSGQEPSTSFARTSGTKLLAPQAQGSAPRRPIPPGMSNHGNTCYLNATLQVLFNLPLFQDQFLRTELWMKACKSAGGAALQAQHQQQGQQEQQQQAPASSSDCSGGGSRSLLFDAMASCLAEQQAAIRKNGGSSFSSDRPTISPYQVQMAMARTAPPNAPRWGSTRQQDAHELLVALLDRLQSEVLAGEASHLRPSTPSGAPPRLRVSRAVELCPCLGSFNGCLQHQLTCSKCHHVTKVKELISHLSLQLPSPGTQATTLTRLIDSYFEPEMVEKTCEKCGAVAAQHQVQHKIRRLPRMLVVHIKRFQHVALENGEHRYNKLHARVQLNGGALNMAEYCLADVPARLLPSVQPQAPTGPPAGPSGVLTAARPEPSLRRSALGAISDDDTAAAVPAMAGGSADGFGVLRTAELVQAAAAVAAAPRPEHPPSAPTKSQPSGSRLASGGVPGSAPAARIGASMATNHLLPMGADSFFGATAGTEAGAEAAGTALGRRLEFAAAEGGGTAPAACRTVTTGVVGVADAAVTPKTVLRQRVRPLDEMSEDEQIALAMNLSMIETGGSDQRMGGAEAVGAAKAAIGGCSGAGQGPVHGTRGQLLGGRDQALEDDGMDIGDGGGPMEAESEEALPALPPLPLVRPPGRFAAAVRDELAGLLASRADLAGAGSKRGRDAAAVAAGGGQSSTAAAAAGRDQEEDEDEEPPRAGRRGPKQACSSPARQAEGVASLAAPLAPGSPDPGLRVVGKVLLESPPLRPPPRAGAPAKGSVTTIDLSRAEEEDEEMQLAMAASLETYVAEASKAPAAAAESAGVRQERQQRRNDAAITGHELIRAHGSGGAAAARPGGQGGQGGQGEDAEPVHDMEMDEDDASPMQQLLPKGLDTAAGFDRALDFPDTGDGRVVPGRPPTDGPTGSDTWAAGTAALRRASASGIAGTPPPASAQPAPAPLSDLPLPSLSRVEVVEDSDVEEEGPSAGATAAASGAAAVAASGGDGPAPAAEAGEQHKRRGAGGGSGEAGGTGDSSAGPAVPNGAAAVAGASVLVGGSLGQQEKQHAVAAAAAKPGPSPSDKENAAPLQRGGAPGKEQKQKMAAGPSGAGGGDQGADGFGSARQLMLPDVAEYRLQAGISHRGATPLSGHYVADVICPEAPASCTGMGTLPWQQPRPQHHLWYHFNDEHVVIKAESKVLEDLAQEGYVLFFVNTGNVRAGAKPGVAGRV